METIKTRLYWFPQPHTATHARAGIKMQCLWLRLHSALTHTDQSSRTLSAWTHTSLISRPLSNSHTTTFLHTQIQLLHMHTHTHTQLICLNTFDLKVRFFGKHYFLELECCTAVIPQFPIGRWNHPNASNKSRFQSWSSVEVILHTLLQSVYSHTASQCTRCILHDGDIRS